MPLTDVVIAGAGPTGLMLACELSLAGVRPLVLDQLPGPSDAPKANGLLGQVVTLVDRRGLFERLAGHPGPPVPNSAYFMFAAMGLDLSRLDDSPLYSLAVPQPHIVRVLADRAAELGVDIRWGHTVTELAAGADSVAIDVEGPAGPYCIDARYVVGADGGHSAVRKRAGIEFAGVTHDRTTSRSAHVGVPAGWVDPVTGALLVPGYGNVTPFLPTRTDHGGFSYAPFPGLPALVTTTEWDQPATDEPMSLDELRASIHRVLGAEIPVTAPTGAGPFVLRRMQGGNTRLARRFRAGRVFLVGDAAHVGTAGGSGLNLGLQDAANLAWKLAADLRGQAPADLLDTFEAERRPAAQRMVMYGHAQGALTAPGADVTGLRELFTELLALPEVIGLLAELTAGSDVSYERNPGAHPLVGRFAPELTVQLDHGPVRLAELTRSARPLLLDLTDNATIGPALHQWRDQIDIVTGRRAATGPGPTALFVRPDSYVAWATDDPSPDAAALDALRQTKLRWLLDPAPRPEPETTGAAGLSGL